MRSFWRTPTRFFNLSRHWGLFGWFDSQLHMARRKWRTTTIVEYRLSSPYEWRAFHLMSGSSIARHGLVSEGKKFPMSTTCMRSNSFNIWNMRHFKVIRNGLQVMWLSFLKWKTIRFAKLNWSQRWQKVSSWTCLLCKLMIAWIQNLRRHWIKV